MPLWGFDRESTQSAAGANTKAMLAKGFQPPFVSGSSAHAGELAEKRNVVATSLGWVRRENRLKSDGTYRTIDQVVVAANPGYNRNYTSNTFLGNPDIVQMYVKYNANGYISANATNANLYVVFNTPINWKASGNQISITVANTSGGNNAVAKFANSTIQGRIVNANNTLVFRLPKMQGRSVGYATYKVNAQTMSVTGNPLYNPDVGIVNAANLVITGAVSNNMLDGTGLQIGVIKVRNGG